eukprot:jgi/Psemu1/301686/fgenesh1_kg.42_\
MQDDCKNTSSKFLVTGKQKSCNWLKNVKKLTKARCKKKDEKGNNVSDLCPKICAKAGVETCWSPKLNGDVQHKEANIEVIPVQKERVSKVKQKKKNGAVQGNEGNSEVGENKGKINARRRKRKRLRKEMFG